MIVDSKFVYLWSWLLCLLQVYSQYDSPREKMTFANWANRRRESVEVGQAKEDRTEARPKYTRRFRTARYQQPQLSLTDDRWESILPPAYQDYHRLCHRSSRTGKIIKTQSTIITFCKALPLKPWSNVRSGHPVLGSWHQVIEECAKEESRWYDPR